MIHGALGRRIHRGGNYGQAESEAQAGSAQSVRLLPSLSRLSPQKPGATFSGQAQTGGLQAGLLAQSGSAQSMRPSPSSSRHPPHGSVVDGWQKEAPEQSRSPQSNKVSTSSSAQLSQTSGLEGGPHRQSSGQNPLARQAT